MALVRLSDRLTKFLMILGAVWAFFLCFFILADIITRALNMPISGTKEIESMMETLLRRPQFASHPHSQWVLPLHGGAA